MGVQLSRSVKGLTVLVTGAASGMGRATAEVFAAEGANVALTDLSADAVEAIAAELRAAGHSARGWALDVSDHAAIRRVVDEVAGAFGSLDCLVNNAGISSFCPIDDEDHYDAVWDRAVLVLLTAHQRIIRAALPHLRKSASPRIVNIASTEALGATSRDSPYAAAKAGVTGLTRALAVELGKEGDHRQRDLSGADPDRDDRQGQRCRQADLRPPPHGPAPLWQPGGSGAHHAQPLLAGGELYHRHDDPGGRRVDGAECVAVGCADRLRDQLGLAGPLPLPNHPWVPSNGWLGRGSGPARQDKADALSAPL
jgi:3-oxoacyl-[acyl-carrier protein] reductase